MYNQTLKNKSSVEEKYNVFNRIAKITYILDRFTD